MQSYEILNQKQGKIRISHEAWRRTSLKQTEAALYFATKHHHPDAPSKLTNSIIEAVQLILKFRKQCTKDIMNDQEPHDVVEVFVGSKKEIDFITVMCHTEMVAQARLFRFKVKERQELLCFQTEFCHQNRSICWTLKLDELCNI